MTGLEPTSVTPGSRRGPGAGERDWATADRVREGRGAAEYTASGHRQMRWPRPDALSILFFVGWVLGILVSTVIPYLILPPTTADPEAGLVGIAFAVTIAGIGIFVLSGLAMWRHLRSQAVLVFALVPAVSIGSGGIILTATLLAI